MQAWHLAELNVARAIAPLDSAELAEFVAALADINALADAAPGFVWRLMGADPNAAAASDAQDPQLLLNMSVWTSPEALFEYVYKSAHTAVMVKRRQWFEKPAAAHMVLWWVPAGHIPSLAEGLERLELLRREGPSASAFTFKQRFPAPGGEGGAQDMQPEPYCSGWQ
jgi:hypothetical protein